MTFSRMSLAFAVQTKRSTGSRSTGAGLVLTHREAHGHIWPQSTQPMGVGESWENGLGHTRNVERGWEPKLCHGAQGRQAAWGSPACAAGVAAERSACMLRRFWGTTAHRDSHPNADALHLVLALHAWPAAPARRHMLGIAMARLL